MRTTDVQVGSTITDGVYCIRVTERVENNLSGSGWYGIAITMDDPEDGTGGTGLSAYVSDYLLTGWRHVPFEWRPVSGGVLEERYVWSADQRYLQREVRRVPVADVDDFDLVQRQDFGIRGDW